MVESERVHRFAGITDASKGINAGINLRIVIVLEDSVRRTKHFGEEVLRKAIAFGSGVSVVQVDSDLRCAEAGGRERKAVLESYDRRNAVGVQRSRRWILPIETPDIS